MEKQQYLVKKFHFLATNFHVVHKPCATESISKAAFLSTYRLIFYRKCADVNVCVKQHDVVTDST